MKSLLFFALVMALSISSLFASANEQRGREIMLKNDQQKRANTEQVHLKMLLINDAGKTQKRELDWIKKTVKSKDEYTLIRFTYPKDIRGTGLLTYEYELKEDDRWLYLPALRRSRRITSSEKSDNFMGTEFSYEDLSNESLDKYRYEFIKESPCGEMQCFVVRAKPTNEQELVESGYSSRELWIEQTHYILTQAKYYDKNNGLIKEFTASDIKKIGNTDLARSHKMEMKNLKTGSVTTMLFEDFLINEPVSDKTLTVRNLERGR
ncbi:outer membrane lipoprotein-sorting protein [Aliikangiella sp. IMCC44359]|uniref:outer membrane lipoprotein-sorting protein n=1 Tax=Aliikangiella sp. IMCC44359 TaxID=3459125 RepID=UPI00403ACC99